MDVVECFMPIFNKIGIMATNDYVEGLRRSIVCYEDTYLRVRSASRRSSAINILPKWDPDLEVCRLWGSLIRKDRSWLKIDERFRGLGAPGALEYLGWSKPIYAEDIWKGKLWPGAVIQAWESRSAFNSVKQGIQKQFGHSMIFREYVRDLRNNIIGIKVADNGYHADNTVSKTEWGFWVAANLSWL